MEIGRQWKELNFMNRKFFILFIGHFHSSLVVSFFVALLYVNDNKDNLNGNQCFVSKLKCIRRDVLSFVKAEEKKKYSEQRTRNK